MIVEVEGFKSFKDNVRFLNQVNANLLMQIYSWNDYSRFSNFFFYKTVSNILITVFNCRNNLNIISRLY